MNRLLPRLCAAAALLCPPDILPEGKKGVLVEVRVDLGPLADRVCVACEVQKGDTLSSLAKQHLGAAERAGEITAQNDGIEPTKLQIGQRLWLPPKDGKVADPTYLFVRPAMVGRASPVVLGAPLPPGRLPVHRFYLVPKAHLSTFAALGRNEAEVTKFAEQHGIQVVEASSPGRYVDRDSPIGKIQATIRFDVDDKGAILTSCRAEPFDKDGKPIAAPAPKSGAGPTAEPKKQWLLLLLAAAGGGWLWHRARRQALQAAMA